MLVAASRTILATSGLASGSSGAASAPAEIIGRHYSVFYPEEQRAAGLGACTGSEADDASSTHRVIRRELLAMVGDKAAEIPILYGGSVNEKNVRSLLDAPGVDGVLVGGASLDAEGWANIVRS